MASDRGIVESLRNEGGEIEWIKDLGTQAFSIQTTNKDQQTYWIVGGDLAGAMYGGLQLVENISFDGLEKDYHHQQDPYIVVRAVPATQFG